MGRSPRSPANAAGPASAGRGPGRAVDGVSVVRRASRRSSGYGSSAGGDGCGSDVTGGWVGCSGIRLRAGAPVAGAARWLGGAVAIRRRAGSIAGTPMPLSGVRARTTGSGSSSGSQVGSSAGWAAHPVSVRGGGSAAVRVGSVCGVSVPRAVRLPVGRVGGAGGTATAAGMPLDCGWLGARGAGGIAPPNRSRKGESMSGPSTGGGLATVGVAGVADRSRAGCGAWNTATPPFPGVAVSASLTVSSSSRSGSA
ncbi:hypothetical protein [Micromonospora pisi]|uniref:hypothetical protein n=1 Tax=Micromonospora pisi TaxID=589240 RepID=UPI003CCC82EF